MTDGKGAPNGEAVDTEERPRPPWSASSEEVTEFVLHFGRSYEAERDEYVDPGPFARPVKAGKNSAIYNAHSYHTKVPPEGIVPYLDHYTRPGDLVLDPFCGSGMTGVACLMTGRHAILNDLSPAATHIAHNYCTPVAPVVLHHEFQRIREAVREEFDWLYGTTCNHGHPATIAYTVWSDVHQCRSCRGEIVLWDAAVDLATGDVQSSFLCPECGKGPWRKAELPLVRSEPVLTVFDCPTCAHARNEHRTTEMEKARIAEIEDAPLPYWVPAVPFDEHHEMWRGGHRDHGISRVRDFWTPRNLRAIARLWSEVEPSPATELRPALRFLLTSVIPNSARTTRYRFHKAGNGPVSGTLYVPSFMVENSLLWLLDRKLQDISAAFDVLSSLKSQSTLTTMHAGQSLPIGTGSIDYLFTDPPFGANIFYSDCSLLWEGWLDFFTDERYEAVWNKSLKPEQGGKTLGDYERLMTEAFYEMHRVLKPGRWASVVFHNSDDRVWQAIQRAAVGAGFELAGAQQLDKVQLTFKGVKGDKGEENVSNKDVVLNLQRPRGVSANGVTLAPDVEGLIADAIVAHLGSDPPADERGLQALQGLAIRSLINAGHRVEVSWRSVQDTLRHLGCKQVEGRWYLPGEEVVGASFLVIHDELSALTWLRLSLEREGPQTRGSLAPAFQQASVGVDLHKTLAELLEENFVLDERSNRRRLPTAQERAQLNDATSLRERREINRLLDGHATRQYSDHELGELAAAAYRMGMYSAVLKLAPLARAELLGDEQRALLAQLQDIARLKLETDATGPTQQWLL